MIYPIHILWVNSLNNSSQNEFKTRGVASQKVMEGQAPHETLKIFHACKEKDYDPMTG